MQNYKSKFKNKKAKFTIIKRIRKFLYLDKSFCFLIIQIMGIPEKIFYQTIKFFLILCFSYEVFGSTPDVKIEFGAEYDINGKHRIDAEGTFLGEYINSSTETDIENAISPWVQFGMPLSENIEMGIGGKYQFPRKQKDFEGNFSFIPIYFFIRAKSLNKNQVNPYIIGQLGYNLFLGDNEYKGMAILTGNYCFAFGLGLFFGDHVNLGISYSVNSGTYDLNYLNNNLKADIKYSQINFLLGLKN
jgi:hypothetical protein